MIRLAIRVAARGRRARARRPDGVRAGRAGGARGRRASSSTRSTARRASCRTLGDVRAAVGDALVEVSTSEVPGVDWHSSTRRSTWARCGCGRRGSRRARARWTSSSSPGQAFGTGSHATTRLTLELLTQLQPAGALADWGCGSGVLAIAAAKLGWAPVLACDIEPESVEAARRRRGENGVSVEVSRCDVRQGGPPAPTVLANLVRPLLLEVAGVLDDVPERPDHLGPRAARGRRGRRGVRRAARGRPP